LSPCDAPNPPVQRNSWQTPRSGYVVTLGANLRLNSASVLGESIALDRGGRLPRLASPSASNPGARAAGSRPSSCSGSPRLWDTEARGRTAGGAAASGGLGRGSGEDDLHRHD